MISPALPDAVDLRRFDVVLLNSSAGKDSMAMLDLVASQARRLGISLVAEFGDRAARAAAGRGSSFDDPPPGGDSR